MVNEYVAAGEAARLQKAVIERLIAHAPSAAKCVFLNCEMVDSPSGMAMSDDLFAVIKPLLGKAKKVRLDMDATTFTLLTALGRQIMNGDRRHLILDLLIDPRGNCRAFCDDGELKRLGGGSRSFKTKHKFYAEIEPWLAQVE
jgi:hypothetical protein